MTNKPWRIADLTFDLYDEPGSGRERATIDGGTIGVIRIVRENGRYWIDSNKGQLSNASEKAANAHLNFLYGEAENG
jgi:hypothetical protein